MRYCGIGRWIDLLDLRAILQQVTLVVNVGRCDVTVPISTACLICTRTKLAVDTCHPKWVSCRKMCKWDFPKHRRPALNAVLDSPLMAAGSSCVRRASTSKPPSVVS